MKKTNSPFLHLSINIFYKKHLLLFFAMLFGFVIQAQTTYTTSGTYTPPCGVTSITVECWGAGGGGGFGRSTSGAAGGGGGGGGYTKATFAVTPNTPITFTVGIGGTGGSSGGVVATAGGTTTFNSSTPVVANGGGFGAGMAVAGNGAAGLGGAGGTYSGGSGAAGQGASGGGGGGGSAGTSSNGNTATTQAGATAVAGGGVGGTGASNTNGTAGTSPGGGGAGGERNGGSKSGGNGADGQIVITELQSGLSISAGANQNLCSGSVLIGGSPTASGSTSPYTYSWNPTTNLSSSSIANPTATPISTTTYTVTVTDAGGCSTTSSTTVTLLAAGVTRTYSGASGGNWNTATNWTPNGVPGTCDNVIINGLQVILNTAANINTLTMTGSSELTTDGSPRAITTNGDVSMDGTAIIRGQSCTGGEVILSCASVTVQSTATFAQFGTSGRGMELFCTGEFRIKNGGKFTWGTGCGSGTAGAPLRSCGSVYIESGATMDFQCPSTQMFINVIGNFTTYGTITVTSGAASSQPTWTIGGNLETYPGSSFVTSGGTNSTITFTVNGNWNVHSGGLTGIGWMNMTINGLTQIDGTLQFAGSNQGTKIFNGNITISATGTWNDAVGESVTINGNVVNNGSWAGCSGGTCTYTFGSVAGTYAISGNPISVSIVSVSASTILNNNGTVSVDGGVANILTGAGTFNNLATGVLFLQGGAGGTIVNVTTFNTTTVGNSVYYSQNANQSIRTPSDGGYYNIACSSGGTKVFQTAGTIAITGTLTIEDAAIFNVSTNTLNGVGNLTMTGTSDLQLAKLSTVPELTGTYSLSGGTITLNGAGDQTLQTTTSGGTTCNNLLLGVSGIKTICGITIMNGSLTISGTATMASCATSIAMGCSGTFTYSSSGSTTLGCDISVGNFSQSAGTINDGGKTITVCGSTWARSAGTFTATGRVIFNGSTTVSGASNTTFNNVTINSGMTLIGDATTMFIKGADFTNNGTYTHNSGTVNFTGTTTVQGSAITTFNNLTISAGTLTGHSTNINIQGNWNNGAAFTHNSGTVTLIGGNAQSVTGNTTFYNFTVNKTTATIATQAAATITVNNLFTMTDGVYATGVNSLSGTAGFTATGGDLQMATISTVPGLTGATYAITGGTVTLNGAGAQTLRTSAATGGNTYYNLLFTASGIKSIGGLTVINGDATVSGTATITANAAFVQAAAKTFTYSSTAGTSILTAATPVSVGNFTMSGAGVGTLDINGSTFTVKGNWLKSAETFTNGGTSRVIFNGAGTAQTYTDNGTILTRVTVNNASGVTLNNDMTISTDLTFTSGIITTGSNNVILNATTTTVNGAGTGFVDGNFRKAIIAGASIRSFEVGTGGNYAPIAFTFTACAGGNITCSAINGDNPVIANSTLDPSATVNLNWLVTNNSAGAITYDAIFNYQVANKDAAFNYLTASVIRYISPLWNTTTIGALNSTNTQITGESSPTNGTSEYYQIGCNYNTPGFYNRVNGITNSWSNKATWIKSITGSISTSGSSTAVTGAGTSFSTDLVAGDIIMLQSAPGTTYTVSSITDNTHLILSAAATIASGSYGVEAIPGVSDFVNIGNTNIDAANTVIQMDIAAPGSINRLQFNSMSNTCTLAHTTANTLTVLTTVTIKQGTAKLNLWDIAAGNAIVNGNVAIGNAINTSNTYNAKITISTGSLEVKSNLVFQAGSAGNAVNATFAFTGAGTLKLGGTFSLDNATSPYYGAFTPGTTSIVNYNGINLAQTINLNSTAPAVTYANLYTNNTFGIGITQPANMDQTATVEIAGDLQVQSGTYNNGGFSIVGAAAKTFSVANGTTFNMTGASAFPSGFGTYTFGATSNTYYKQTTTPLTIFNVASPGYGYLFLYPAGIATQRFSNAAYFIQSDLTIGNSTNTTTVNASAATATVNVSGNVNISSNATLNCSTFALNMFVGGNWVNNGGNFTQGTSTVTFNGGGNAQLISGSPITHTFYNITVNKAGGSLATGAAVTTLTTNNIILSSTNTATFTSPGILNINATAAASSLTLSGGTFVAGATTNITGNWTHDNTLTAFTNSSGTVNFTGAAGQTINGSGVSETFYNVVVAKTAGQLLNTGGSIATINLNNFTETTGNFTAPATVSGNDFTFTAGTYTAGANTNISGNVLFNGATFTPGLNTVTFNGVVSQTLGGSGAIPTLYKLTLNNGTITNTLTLNKPLTVSNLLTLTKGQITTTSTNILTLAAGSPTPTLPGAIDDSFVNGPMIHVKASTLSETFVFPVGKSNQAHRIDLIIGHSAVTSTNYTGEFYFSSAVALNYGLPVTCSKTSYIDYWDISSSGGSSVTTASVKMYYYTVDQVDDAPNLTVLHGDPSMWADIGGAASGIPIGTITSSVNFTTFSKFAFGNKIGGTNPLPIELLSFDAKPNGSVVDLTWETASEKNNDYFTIEKTKDGSNFETVEKVNGAGNSTSLLNYSAIDTHPYEGVSYYRLKQTDYNGDFTYSNLVSIEFKSNSEFSFNVYPNPNAGESINLSLIAAKGDEILVVVYDISGKESYSKIIVTEDSGEQVYAIDPSQKLAPGIYLISGTDNQKIYSKKLIVK